MDVTRCATTGGGIPDGLWPEIVPDMVDVKNLRPIKHWTGKALLKPQEKNPPILDHLMVIGPTVYVLIHKKERQDDRIKSAKFAPRVQIGMMMGYDGHSIYRVFLEDDTKLIRVKDLRIYEEATSKNKTSVPTYETIIAAEQEWKAVSCSPDMDSKSFK